MSRKFVALVQGWLVLRELPKMQVPFDSAEVRFAQDDRVFWDRNLRERTLVAWRRRRRGSRRRNGTVLGAQISDQLGDFGVGKRGGKRRHLLAAVENLIGDFLRR